MNKLSDYVRQGRPLPWPGIVDMHAHLGAWYGFAIAGHDADAIVRQMDRVGVERTICAHQAAMTGHVEFGNDEVLRAMRRHPGRILGYAVAYPLNDRLGLDEVERCMEKGMAGIKLHEAAGIPYASEKYAKIWRYADRHGLPVLLHTWTGVDGLAPIFRRYRRAKILLGHAGANQPERYAALARKYANVYLELAGSLARYGLVEYFVRQVGARKVIFGSDVPWMAISQQIGRIVFAGITEAQKKDILVNNAARILKTKPGGTKR